MKIELTRELDIELRRARQFIASGRAREYKNNILFITKI